EKEVDISRMDLYKTRTEYAARMKARLAEMDSQLDAIVVRGDAKAQDAVIKMREERDELMMKLSHIGNQVESTWDEYRRDFDTRIDQLQREIDSYSIR